MKYEFFVEVGDWSKDGHNQSEKILVKASKPIMEIEKAFLSVATRIGLVVNGNFVPFSEYEDCKLSLEHASAIESIGLQLGNYFFLDSADEDYEEIVLEDATSLVSLLMDIARTELQFEYTIAGDETPIFCRGNMSFGYGLYN